MLISQEGCVVCAPPIEAAPAASPRRGRGGGAAPAGREGDVLQRLHARGDELAWRLFERDYRESLVRYAMRRGLAHCDAEDVVQGVFAALLEILPRLVIDPAKGQLRNYLFAVMRHELGRQRRRLRRSRGVGLRMVQTWDRGAGRGAVETAIESQWASHHYRLAMETVGRTSVPAHVAVFERLVAGERPESLAAAFSLPSASVRKIKQRMGARVRAEIERQVGREER